MGMVKILLISQFSKVVIEICAYHSTLPTQSPCHSRGFLFLESLYHPQKAIQYLEPLPSMQPEY